MERAVAAYEDKDDRSLRAVINNLWCEFRDLAQARYVIGQTTPRRERRRRPLAVHVEIEEAIRRSSDILSQRDDSDGSTYSQETWERATSLLRDLAVYSLDQFSKMIDVPYIDPGPRGSIDLHWKHAHCELLINVPADAHLPPTYYGDDYGNSIVKGKLDSIGNRRVVAVWLLEHQQ